MTTTPIWPLLVGMTLFAGAAPPPPSLPGPLEPVTPDRLCVTLGQLETTSGAMHVEAPKVRAVAAGDPSRAELRFVYQGPTTATAALASGALRNQIGLKLRAESGCNLLYVMWRLEPDSRLVVSTKHNPGQRLHAECGTRGYANLRPSKVVAMPAVAPGSSHVLGAVLRDGKLVVQADGATVWEGDVPAGSIPAGGYAGFRTDNVKADVELRVARGTGGLSCVKGDE